MKDYVIINGVSSKTKTGLAINILPPITKPEMRTLVEEIDGRDGDIITKLGYSAYDKTIEIGLFGNGYDVDDIIAFFNQEGTIIFSNEPTKYYNFTLVDSFDIERLLQFKTSTITFHCQPFKYEVGETPKEIEYEYVNGEGTEITFNNTMNALMELELNPSELTQETTPTPDNPSEVQVIKGNNSIVIRNENLFSSEWEQGSIDSSTGQNQTNANIIRTKDYIPVTALQHYSIRRSIALQYISVRAYDKSKNYLGSGDTVINLISGQGQATANNPMVNGTDRCTISAKEGVCYLRFQDACNDLSTKYMMVKGDVSADYVENQHQELPLNLPVENLFNKNDITSSNGYISDANGNFISNSSQPTKASNYINVRGINKIHFSTNMTTNRWGAFYDENQSFISGFNFSTTNPVTVPSNAYYMRATVQISILDEFQIEPGEVENQYTPFGTTPIEYCKIGTYEDEFEHNGDKWYLNKYIGKSIFTGANTESWNKETVSGNPNYYISIPSARGGNSSPILNSIGIYGASIIGDGNNHKTYISSGGNKWLNYRCDEITTLENFRTMLGNTNMVVYYQLATPTHDEITDETLINQLNAIEQAVSYDEQTNISQTNTQLPFIIKATAMISGSDSVEITNNGNVYAKPILDIKGTGIINVYLNGTQMFSVNITDEIVVDIANLESYNPNTSALMNRYVTGDISQFVIPVGTNTISVDGAVENVTITMYQRWL